MNSKTQKPLTFDKISFMLMQNFYRFELDGNWSCPISITSDNMRLFFDSDSHLIKISFTEDCINYDITDVDALCDLDKVLEIFNTKSEQSIHNSKFWSEKNNLN